MYGIDVSFDDGHDKRIDQLSLPLAWQHGKRFYDDRGNPWQRLKLFCDEREL
jgi:hypothetical protein